MLRRSSGSKSTAADREAASRPAVLQATDRVRNLAPGIAPGLDVRCKDTAAGRRCRYVSQRVDCSKNELLLGALADDSVPLWLASAWSRPPRLWAEAAGDDRLRSKEVRPTSAPALDFQRWPDLTTAGGQPGLAG